MNIYILLEQTNKDLELYKYDKNSDAINAMKDRFLFVENELKQADRKYKYVLKDDRAYIQTNDAKYYWYIKQLQSNDYEHGFYVALRYVIEQIDSYTRVIKEEEMTSSLKTLNAIRDEILETFKQNLKEKLEEDIKRFTKKR